MSRTSRSLLAVLVLGYLGSAWAAEDKTDKLTGDVTTSQYQRKSITYLGAATSKVVIDEEQKRIVEVAIRNGIELKRFDYNEIDMRQIGSLDDLVMQLKNYVKKASMDRAAAEAEYEARFKSARVYMKDIERIMSSAYFYEIKLRTFDIAPFVCPNNAAQAAKLGCPLGASMMNAKVDASVAFHKANLLDESAPAHSFLKEIYDVPKTDSEIYESPPVPPSKAGKEEMERYRAALASYRARLPQLQHEAGLKAAARASTTLSQFLSKKMKQISDFQLLTPVSGASREGVEFMLGESVGLGLDDTYDVMEFNATGTRSLIGYVKVRSIGTATGTGDGSPSFAAKVKEQRGFVGGELLMEHPMVGLSVGVHGVFEVAPRSVVHRAAGVGFYPGVGFYADKDIANLIKWPEAYVSVEGDVLALLTDSYGRGWTVLHLMLGFKKKWYFSSLALTAGARLGIANYSNQAGTGVGLDLVGGAEYYIKPEWSIYLKVAGRAFSSPVGSAEVALNTSLGVLYAF